LYLGILFVFSLAYILPHDVTRVLTVMIGLTIKLFYYVGGAADRAGPGLNFGGLKRAGPRNLLE